MGEFVLPLRVPTVGKDGTSEVKGFDDFTFDAASWTLTVHEGRPGHELQFAAIIEKGVSTARALFAANSVNIEGWALYAEAETKPYEPLDGQLIALQHRLLRATRAFLEFVRGRRAELQQMAEGHPRGDEPKPGGRRSK